MLYKSTNPAVAGEFKVALFEYSAQGLKNLQDAFDDPGLIVDKDRHPGARATGKTSGRNGDIPLTLSEGVIYVVNSDHEIVGTFNTSDELHRYFWPADEPLPVQEVAQTTWQTEALSKEVDWNAAAEQIMGVPPLEAVTKPSGPPPLEAVTKPSGPPPLVRVSPEPEPVAPPNPAPAAFFNHNPAPTPVPASKPLQTDFMGKQTWPTPERQDFPKSQVVHKAIVQATSFLSEAGKSLATKAEVRDAAEGERSMARTVAAFNALTGKNLTVAEGWEFMILLKLVRGRQGFFNADDYVDIAGYGALLGEQESQDKPRR